MSQQRLLALKAPRRQRFANFIAGPNQALVDTLVHGLEPGGWYFLAGPPGSGRSHLLNAVLAERLRAGEQLAFIALGMEANRPLLDQSSADWLLLDDVDALAGQEEAERALFNALNRWRAERCGVLMSAVGREDFELPDLRSRLGQATRLTLKLLDDRQLRTLVERLADEYEVVLGRGAVDYLLSRSERNPAAIARLIEGLAQRALSERRTLGIPLIRDALNPEGG